MRSQLIWIGITLALSTTANIDHRNCCTDFPLIPYIAKKTHDTAEDEHFKHFKSRHNKRDIKNVMSTKKPSQQKRNDITVDHFRSDGHVFSANRTFSVEDLVTYPTPRDEYNRFGGHLEHIRLHCNSPALAKMKNLIGDVDQPLETKVITLAISSVAIGCPATAFYLTNLLMNNRNNQNLSHLIINEGPKENVSTPCNRSNAEKLKMLIKGNEKFVSIYELVAPTIFLSLKCDDIGKREFEQFLSDFKPNTNQTHISKNQRLVKYLNQRKGQLSTLLNFEKEEIRGQNKNDSNSTENKRKKRTSENNEIETHFTVHKKCAIVRPLGEALNPVSKIDCLQFCLDEEGCKSVSYKNDNSQVCHLNIENRKDVGGFFTCRTADTGNWDYFEKKKSTDYFYISNKATAMVLEVKRDFSVIMKSYSGKDNQLWYWDNDAIRSKQYPSRLLQFSVSEYKSTGLGKTYLSSNQQGQNYLWNFEDNQLTSQYQNLKLDVKDGNKAEGTPVGVTVNSYQEWGLSLERIYFIITSRYSGKVLEADTQGNVHLGTYDGTDNQFWFWDDENIRCKKIPDKVLDLHMADYEATNWGKVYLHTYNTGNNQKWVADNDKIVSFYKNLSLDVNLGPNSNGIMVGGYASHGGINQKWSFAFSRPYFFILNKESGKVLDASSPTTIELRHYNFIDQQLWFWDNDVLRNKKYTDKVMDLHMYNYINHHWGKIYLHTFNDGDNQKWTIDNNILLSKFNNLSVEVKSASQAEGSEIGASGRKSQKWTLQLEHDFFIISSRLHAKVLDAPSVDQIMMWSYNGKDHQLWFMDEDSIRSKKYPNKVLDLSITQYNRDGWGKVYLHSYHGGDNQRWTVENENIISRFHNLRLDIKFSNTDDGALVGGSPNTGNLNQKWNFNPKERAYFVVKGVGSRKVLDAPSDSSVIMWSHNGKDHQLWFLDGDCIRSKKYPNKVLDFHMADYNRDGWGKVYLHVFNGGLNQFWSIEEPFIISSYRHLYLDVKDNAKSDGSLVGGYEFNGNDNQKWEITFPNSKKSGCIDKTEEKIYNVVQYIPLVGTFWDLFSSIAYASTGCTSVARERGISFGIGIALDVTTVLTGGAAAGATTAIKTGVKVGFKVGIKQGMKATVLVTKQSIKNVVKTAAKKGIKGSLKAGFKKSGKLVVREVIVDPALFLKNAGKISRKILIHPKRTLKGTWKAARHNIDDLKRLRKRLKDDPSFPKLRCKRGGNALSCLKPPKTELYATESQTLMFKSLADETALSARIERSADRFMARQGGNFERELSSAPLTVQRQLSAVDSNVEKAELWAVYKYTKESGSVNNFAGTAFTGKPLISTQRNNPISEETAKFLLDSVDETIDQADLIQSYLKKHPQNQEITVYRWEQAFENYKDNGIYETFTFKSTSARNERIKDLGLDLTNIDKYPIEMKINLKRSGTKISDLSDFASQEEYLIPIGTKFRVNVEVRPSDPRIQHVTFTEITQ